MPCNVLMIPKEVFFVVEMAIVLHNNVEPGAVCSYVDKLADL